MSLQCRFNVLGRLLAVLAFSAVLAFGQGTGTILGSVRDGSGALIAQASVIATNTATGVARRVLTDAQGNYRIAPLLVGPYTIKTSLKGFKEATIEGVVLQVAQEARIDVRLEIGDVKESVVVSASAPLVQSESGAIGQVIENKKIVELPLNGRNFTQLAALTPGAITSNIGGITSGEQHGLTTVAISGGQSSKTEFLLDGITNQEQLYDGVALSPSVDAINEFRVQANAFSAEYGRGSAVINATIKGGTNEYHGVAFEFLRNDQLDARNYFAAQRAPRRQNQFGGSFGGPILKNKLFFFGNYEGTRIRLPGTRNVRVPSAALRAGTLSGNIKDPLSNAPFANSQIPASRIDPIATYFLQFVPLPNTPDGQTFIWNASGKQDANQGNGRIDYAISSKDQLNLRYSVNLGLNESQGALPTSGGRFQQIDAHNAGIGYTRVFSPTLVNELRLGYARLVSANRPQGLGTNYTVDSGILGFAQTSLNFPGFPSIGAGGYGITDGTAFSPIQNPTNTYQITDAATWTVGRHTVKFGIDLRRFHATSTNSAFSRGSFSFNGRFSGDSFADYLLGYPSSGIRDFPRNHFGFVDRNYHFFVQDDIKVNNKLTVNVGLRYELNEAIEQDLAQNSYFDLNRGKWIVSTLPNGNINLTTQQVSSLAYSIWKDSIITAKEAGLDNNLQTPSRKQFAPRIGFAYRPFADGKTVVRAGYGIFYLLGRGNQSVSNGIVNLPFILDEFKNGNFAANGYSPQFTTRNFFDAPFGFGGPLLSQIDLKMMRPYMQQWNFAVQREIIRNLALDIAYVANKGTHLEKDILFNFSTPGTGSIESRRRYPQFGTGDNYTNIGNSNYNSLQVKLEKRYSAGLTLLTSYTWSKLIDDTAANSYGFAVQDPRNLSLDRGLGNSDIPHRFVTSFSYELPFGSTGSPLVKKAIGGWSIGGIAQYQSGFPFTPTMNAAPSTTEYGYRPDQIGSPDVSNQSVNQWFNPKAFQVPGQFRIGTAGRNILRGPGIKNWDLSILKSTRINERFTHQFRFEGFNLWNTSQFSTPDSNIQNSTAGRIFSARDARIIQLAMKLYF